MDFSKVPLEGGTELWEAVDGNNSYTIARKGEDAWTLWYGVQGKGVSPLSSIRTFMEAALLAEMHSDDAKSPSTQATPPQDTVTCALRQINILAVGDVLRAKSSSVYLSAEQATQAAEDAIGTLSYTALHEHAVRCVNYYNGFGDAIAVALKTIAKEARKNEQTRTSATDKTDE